MPRQTPSQISLKRKLNKPENWIDSEYYQFRILIKSDRKAN